MIMYTMLEPSEPDEMRNPDLMGYLSRDQTANISATIQRAEEEATGIKGRAEREKRRNDRSRWKTLSEARVCRR